MAKQTSRMYGIKVKERVNYYEFGANDGFITLFYLSDVGSGAWQIKAGKHDGTNPADDVEWWMNGVKYNAGDVIHSWNDGDIVTFHILESHTGTIPYTNYMYDIFGNAAENIEYGNKDITYRIVPSNKSQYACKVYKLENGIIVSTKEFTSEDIRNYKETYSQIQNNPLYPVYNMLFDWHGADPHSGYPQMSFQAISNSNYIKYNGNTIGVNETIRTWQAIGFLGFEVTDDSDKYTAKKKGVDALPSVQLVKRIGGANIATANKDKSNIFSDVYHDHKEVYYNGNYHKAMYLVYDNVGVQDCWRKTIGSLALTYAYPYWFLMAIKAGVEYAGTTYEARKLIRSWKPSDTVNMTLREKISKRKADSKETNKVVYDITKTANVDSITVIMQEIDANRQYTDLDTITFTSSDSPVTFHNLQYKFESTKWTIISKCGYIKYNGNTYPNNRRILSFNLDEDVHIEITDETNKYLVETEITYTVKTPNSDVQALYSVHTSETAKTLKLVKSISDKEEPWVTVYFYDAMYKPVEYDDISVRFDNTNMEWELYSNNDNLYFNGTNYSKGSLLSSWSYDTIAKIGNIVVTHENHDAIEVVELEKSNTKSITNTDVDEDIAWHNADSIDFHISYSFAKGVWTIKAVKDCWMNGIHLFNGDIIKQFKTKTFVDPFSFLFAYRDDEESPVITNIVYTVEATVGFDGVTNVSVSSSGHPSESFTDKDISNGSEKTLIFTKQDARSMYGYIWQKEETPPPGPWPSGYIGDIIVIQDPSDNRFGTLCYIIPNELYHRKIIPSNSRQGWLTIYLTGFSYFFDSENKFYIHFYANEVFWYGEVNNNTYIYSTQRYNRTSFYIPQTQSYFSNFDMVGKFIEKESCVSIYSYGTYTEQSDRWLFLIMKSRYRSNGEISVQFQQAIDIPINDINLALQTDFDQIRGDGYIYWANYLTPYMKVNSLTKAVYFCCPKVYSNESTIFKYLTFKFYEETLSLIEIPDTIINQIKDSVYSHGKNIIINPRTLYFNNTFYVIIYAGVYENLYGHYDRIPPEQWDPDIFHAPSVFLLTYNDISGFNLYDLGNDSFAIDDRVSPILETHITSTIVQYSFEKFYGLPIRLYEYQNELYMFDTRFDEIVDTEWGGKAIAYKRCVYKLDEENHTFIKLKEFKTEDIVNIYDIVNKENVEINIYQLLNKYNFITNEYENFTYLEHIQNVSRSLRRKDLVNGLYFIYNEHYNDQTIYYFTNPLFDEDDMNFCFSANTIGFRDRYSEDGSY